MIRNNVLYSFLVNLLNIGYPLISFTYVSKILNPDGVGLFNYALSIVSYFLVLSNIGIPRIAPVEVAKIKDDKTVFQAKIKSYFSLNIITSSIVMVLYGFTIFLFIRDSLLQHILLILIGLIISNTIGLDWLMQSMLHFKQIVIRDLFVKILSLICLFLFVKTESDILIYAGLYIMSSLISALVNFLFLKNRYRIEFEYHRIFHYINIKDLVIKIFPISILTTVYLFFDVTLAGLFLSMYDVGLYSFAIKIVRLFLIIFDSIFVVLTPVLAYKLNQLSDIDEVNNMLRIILSNLFGLFLPLCFLLYIFSDKIVYFLGGEAFFESSLLLRWLIPMTFFYIYSSFIGSQILYNIGEYLQVRNILFYVLVISLVIGFFVISEYGLFGVIVTINFAFLALTALYYRYTVKRFQKIRLFSPKDFMIYFFSSLIPFLLLTYNYNQSNKNVDFYDVLYITLYLGIYLVILFVFREKYIVKHFRNFLNQL